MKLQQSYQVSPASYDILKDIFLSASYDDTIKLHGLLLSSSGEL